MSFLIGCFTMKRKAKLKWIEQAELDLLEIRARIAQAYPTMAAKYLRRLRKSVDSLRWFPMRGWVVEELNDPTVREIVFDVYRVIYHYAGADVTILTVYRASRLLHARYLKNIIPS